MIGRVLSISSAWLEIVVFYRMPRKTRRRVKHSLKPFDFGEFDALMSKDVDSCNKWQTESEPECSDKKIFLDGHARVYKKYGSIFPDIYSNYMNMNIDALTRLIPKMPKKNCKQVVIGTGEDIVIYIAVNNHFKKMGSPLPFLLFMPPEWDEATNLIFTQCAVLRRLNNCPYEYFLRILLPKNRARLFDASGKARISLLEICTISKYVKDMELEAFILKTPAKMDHDIVFVK